MTELGTVKALKAKLSSVYTKVTDLNNGNAYRSATSSIAYSIKINYDDLLKQLSQSAICILNSPNRLKQEDWNKIEGSFYERLNNLIEKTVTTLDMFYKSYDEVIKLFNYQNYEYASIEKLPYEETSEDANPGTNGTGNNYGSTTGNGNFTIISETGGTATSDWTSLEELLKILEKYGYVITLKDGIVGCKCEGCQISPEILALLQKIADSLDDQGSMPGEATDPDSNGEDETTPTGEENEDGNQAGETPPGNEGDEGDDGPTEVQTNTLPGSYGPVWPEDRDPDGDSETLPTNNGQYDDEYGYDDFPQFSDPTSPSFGEFTNPNDDFPTEKNPEDSGNNGGGIYGGNTDYPDPTEPPIDYGNQNNNNDPNNNTGGDKPGQNTPSGSTPGGTVPGGTDTPENKEPDRTPSGTLSGDNDSPGGNDSNQNLSSGLDGNTDRDPNVSVENVGKPWVTVPGAAVSAGVLGATGSYLSGGTGGGSYYGGTATEMGNTTDPNSPQFGGTAGEQDEDKKKKAKYVFESISPTVENPSLDAGLLEPDSLYSNVAYDTIEPTNNATSGSTEMSENGTNLGTILGLGGITAGLGVGGAYLAQTRKEEKEKAAEQKKKQEEQDAQNLGLVGGIMGASFISDDDDEDEKKKKPKKQNNRGFFN